MKAMTKVVRHVAKIPFPKIVVTTDKEQKAIVIPAHMIDSVMLYLGAPAGVLAVLLTAI